MPHWNGNNYNRAKELPQFLAKLNPEKLQEFGKKKKNKSFMTNYNYSSGDKDYLALRNKQRVISYPGIAYKINSTTKVG